jgi:glycosyltransferase involved in cell wall biosynthesis
MRTAVYNRYWATGGGAEKYGGAIAEILSADGPLDLLSHDPVDLDWLADRLRLDLSKVGVRLMDDAAGEVTRASGDYDLFVNVSYMSTDRAASPTSLYVVHFPTRLEGHLSPFRRQVTRLTASRRDKLAPVTVEWGSGFHGREGSSRGVVWTNGRGQLRLTTRPGDPVGVELVFGNQRPSGLGPVTVAIEVDGRVVSEVEIEPPSSRITARRGVAARIEVASSDAGEPVDLAIVSDTFMPAEVLGTDDRRHLGVPLVGLHLGTGPLARIGRWFPTLSTRGATVDWTDSYGLVVANSQFTQRWIDEYWDRPSEVLYPPVTMHKPGTKRNVILNVGRFFPSDKGHSKKQREMVRAFRRLVDRGMPDWTLHLVGGCSEAGTAYLEEVRALASGYPVEFHVNARGDELDALYGSAAIYWHASGLGEDPQRHPGRLEHFGISTVEAMSAGAVPVVIGLAGQRETVRHGIDGFHFRTLEGLCSLTEMLIRDEPLRQRMAASGTARARRYAVDAFGEQLHVLVDQVTGRDRGPARAGRS